MAPSWRFCGDFTTFLQRLARSVLGIGTVILCRRQKKRRERKIWVKPWISTRETDGALQRQSACAQRLIKNSSSEGDEVFLFLLELSHFFGDFFEVVLQATCVMFVTNYPRGTPK